MAVSAILTDTSPGGAFGLLHSGSVYVAWSELTDLYDTGKTPISEAHATLQKAATRWLDRPAEPDADFIERWASEASQAVAALYERDGNWWREPLIKPDAHAADGAQSSELLPQEVQPVDQVLSDRSKVVRRGHEGAQSVAEEVVVSAHRRGTEACEGVAEPLTCVTVGQYLGPKDYFHSSAVPAIEQRQRGSVRDCRVRRVEEQPDHAVLDAWLIEFQGKALSKLGADLPNLRQSWGNPRSADPKNRPDMPRTALSAAPGKFADNAHYVNTPKTGASPRGSLTPRPMAPEPSAKARQASRTERLWMRPARSLAGHRVEQCRPPVPTTRSPC